LYRRVPGGNLQTRGRARPPSNLSLTPTTNSAHTNAAFQVRGGVALWARMDVLCLSDQQTRVGHNGGRRRTPPPAPGQSHLGVWRVRRACSREHLPRYAQSQWTFAAPGGRPSSLFPPTALSVLRARAFVQLVAHLRMVRLLWLVATLVCVEVRVDSLVSGRPSMGWMARHYVQMQTMQSLCMSTTPDADTTTAAGASLEGAVAVEPSPAAGATEEGSIAAGAIKTMEAPLAPRELTPISELQVLKSQHRVKQH